MDTVARIGGDEFVVLAPDLADQLEAVHIAARLAEQPGAAAGRRPRERQRHGQHRHLGRRSRRLDRRGDALRGRHGDVPREVPGSESGRGVRRGAQSPSQRTGRHRGAPATALAERRVVPHYQPIIDLSTGQVAGFEALARIVASPTRRCCIPDTFIDVAEECGLVVPLGAQMLSAACRRGPAVARRGQGGDVPDRRRESVAASTGAIRPGSADTGRSRRNRPGRRAPPPRDHRDRPHGTAAPKCSSNSIRSETWAWRSASTTSAPATPRSPTSAASP